MGHTEFMHCCCIGVCQGCESLRCRIPTYDTAGTYVCFGGVIRQHLQRDFPNGKEVWQEYFTFSFRLRKIYKRKCFFRIKHGFLSYRIYSSSESLAYNQIPIFGAVSRDQSKSIFLCGIEPCDATQHTKCSSISDKYIPPTLIHEDILHTRIRTESNNFM